MLHAKIFVIALGCKHDKTTLLAITLDMLDLLCFELLKLSLLVLTILIDIKDTVLRSICKNHLLSIHG
jgi:hypothetical protein